MGGEGIFKNKSIINEEKKRNKHKLLNRDIIPNNKLPLYTKSAGMKNVQWSNILVYNSNGRQW